MPVYDQTDFYYDLMHEPEKPVERKRFRDADEERDTLWDRGENDEPTDDDNMTGSIDDDDNPTDIF